MTNEQEPKTNKLLSPGELPVCNQAKEFLDLLRNTEEYQARVSQRLENALQLAKMITLSPDESPTYEEVATSFEGVDEFERLFWDFAEGVIHLRYEPIHYSEKFQEAFTDYRRKAMISFMAAEI